MQKPQPNAKPVILRSRSSFGCGLVGLRVWLSGSSSACAGKRSTVNALQWMPYLLETESEFTDSIRWRQWLLASFSIIFFRHRS